MQTNPLGQTGLQVSALCLGTMTYGEQNTPAEAFAQLDQAVAAGVNFIDTAEMYPVPARADTQGRSEQILGDWLQQRGGRAQLVIATKIAPYSPMTAHLRGPGNRFDRANIQAAVTASLQRLRTDYIDLYQLHWPERQSNFFSKRGYTATMAAQDERHLTPLAETLSALADEVRAGRIRAIGLSNETPWGVMQFLHLAESLALPRVASIQNPYSLLNRSFEIGLAEMALREHCGLLAYSPLGFGVLSGKYLKGDAPAEARLNRFPQYSRYTNPQALQATRAYVDLARQHGLDPAQMALAFVRQQPFVTSTIVGATTPHQLASNLASAQLTLSADLLQAIEALHTQQPDPAP